MLKGYSSYSKLLRIVAYCLRFRPNNKYSGPLIATESNEAETRVLKILQSVRLRNELKSLKRNDIPNRGKIANLNPFLDDQGLIRVGGRLRKANLTFSQKHAILLPNQHRITDNIIREIHENHHHPGIQTTLYIVRQNFWLFDGQNQVRKIIRACTQCLRYNAILIEYKMGDLPQTRIRETTPFMNTGIDYCGPFFIKEKKFRNRGRIKVHVCVVTSGEVRT